MFARDAREDEQRVECGVAVMKVAPAAGESRPRERGTETSKNINSGRGGQSFSSPFLFSKDNAQKWGGDGKREGEKREQAGRGTLFEKKMKAIAHKQSRHA